jgi:hsp70-interacting protein
LGRPDSELMKEDMKIATDSTRTEDERVNALDHLEMVRSAS